MSRSPSRILAAVSVTHCPLNFQSLSHDPYTADRSGRYIIIERYRYLPKSLLQTAGGGAATLGSHGKIHASHGVSRPGYADEEDACLDHGRAVRPTVLSSN